MLSGNAFMTGFIRLGPARPGRPVAGVCRDRRPGRRMVVTNKGWLSIGWSQREHAARR
jgi:hypothetical protein